jgi:hypothetical protein
VQNRTEETVFRWLRPSHQVINGDLELAVPDGKIRAVES